MKKNFKMTVAAMVVAMVGVGAYMTQNQQKGTMSDIALANVDALADDTELGHDLIPCYSSLVYEEGSSVVDCATCTRLDNKTDAWYASQSKCTRNT